MSDIEEGEISVSSDESPKQTTIVYKRPRIVRKVHRHREQKQKQQKKQQKPKGFSSSNYKTVDCEYFKKGKCLKGDDCTYKHDFAPNIPKKICKFFLSGACTKENCQFSHSTKHYPCRFLHIDRHCQLGSACRFSHEEIPENFFEEYMKDNKDYILKLYKENRLNNEDLFRFIKDDLPKKDLAPPPIDQLTEFKPSSPPKESLISKGTSPPSLVTPSPSPIIPSCSPDRTARQVQKRDPRLRLLKPQADNIEELPKPKRVIPQDPRLKREQKEEEVRHQQQSKNFYKNIREFFFTYY